MRASAFMPNEPGTPSDDRRQAIAPQASPQEIELKLRCSPGDLERLRNVAAIAGRTATRGVVCYLESRYYDTLDLTLQKRDVVLRVRKTGRRFVETMKPGVAPGALLAHGEWESPVEDFTPDVSAGRVADTPLAYVRLQNLRPLFTTRVRLYKMILGEADPSRLGAEIEAAFDSGTVEVGHGSGSISEIELQLRKGSPEALYRVALELEQSAAVQVETRRKSARGYALASSGPAAWHKAGPHMLSADKTVDDAFASLAKACLRHWQKKERPAVEGNDAEGVHQVRVALRRLLSLFVLFKPALHDDHRLWLADQTKAALKALGARPATGTCSTPSCWGASRPPIPTTRAWPGSTRPPWPSATRPMARFVKPWSRAPMPG